VVVGRNKPTRQAEEKAVEGVRDAEDGTKRDTGTPRRVARESGVKR